jgi:hypothetical protein
LIGESLSWVSMPHSTPEVSVSLDDARSSPREMTLMFWI